MFDLQAISSSTIRKKLVMEIASLDLDTGAAPVQFAEASEATGIVKSQLKLLTTKTDCTVGEQVWGGGRGFGKLQGLAVG